MAVEPALVRPRHHAQRVCARHAASGIVSAPASTRVIMAVFVPFPRRMTPSTCHGRFLRFLCSFLRRQVFQNLVALPFLLRFSPLTRRWLSFLVPQAFLLLILQKQKLTRSTLENLSHLGLLQIGINTDKNEKFDNNPRLRVPRTNGVLSTPFLSLTCRMQPTRYHYLCRISKRGRR